MAAKIGLKELVESKSIFEPDNLVQMTLEEVNQNIGRKVYNCLGLPVLIWSRRNSELFSCEEMAGNIETYHFSSFFKLK